jgi:hypothetical protein
VDLWIDSCRSRQQQGSIDLLDLLDDRGRVEPDPDVRSCGRAKGAAKRLVSGEASQIAGKSSVDRR